MEGASQGADCIVSCCCFLRSVAGDHGSGFIVEFEGLQSAVLLALDWKQRRKRGQLQTSYALITSHDTVPGLSLSTLKDWKVSCQGIKNGDELALSDLVCGVISCCGSESLFAGQVDVSTVTVFRAHHKHARCAIELNITILFLNHTFEKLHMQQGTVSPPVVSVPKCLDQNAFAQEYKQIINTGSSTTFYVYRCDGIRSVKTSSISVVEWQGTSERFTKAASLEQQDAPESLGWEIAEFEKLQKLELNCSVETEYHGSPVVYHSPDTSESFVIGVHVGDTDKNGKQLLVTFHGILRLLQGGLIPVLSVLRCLTIPKAWVSRWSYLLTPHIDKMERMESGYLCEVLHFLLRKRYGTPFLKISVDLVDVDNEASLDLLCALFKHFESIDNADLNEAVAKLNLENEINDYITKLCKDVINLLELGIMVTIDRTSLVEKCCIFYNLLLNIKFAGITGKILHTYENLERLKHIQQRYKHSDVVCMNVSDILLKCSHGSKGADESSHSIVRHYLSRKELLALKYVIQEDVIDSLEQIGLDLKTVGDSQITIEELQRALYSLDQHEVASNLRQQLDFVLENQPHYEAYQRALEEEVAIPLKYLKVLFFGPPRTGKTSMRRRLVGEIQNLANKPVQASTGTAEVYDVIVKLVEDKTTTSTAAIVKVAEDKTTTSTAAIVKVAEDKTTTSRTVITKSEWSTVQTLFGQKRDPCVTDLDDELRLLYQFISTYRFVPTIEKESNPVIEEETEEFIPDEGNKGQRAIDNVPSATELPQSTDAIDFNTSESSGDGLTRKEKEEIEKAFEAFEKILHTAGQEQLKVLLDGTILMNMVDTGGQPAFLEMVPALTMGPALYLIFFRLDQELKERYGIKYVSKDNEQIELGSSSYTVEEVIFQALSSIACFSCTTNPNPAKVPNPSNAAMLVGTHKDLLGSDPKIVATEIKAKDDALQESLQEIFDLVKSDKSFLHHASIDQLMFPIDNMTGDDRELKAVRERLEEVIKQMFDDNIPIPASWLMFSIFLRRISKMGNRTLSLPQCHEIGNRLNVRDTDEALWFLHHCVGMLMHFPKVEEIKDIVICDPQVVFDSVTYLILNSFNLKRVSKLVCDKFKETGQFSSKDIQRIASNSESDSLRLPELVKLLEHLNIIAPIETEGSSSQSDAQQKIYFMPAVLKHATEEELQMRQSSTDPVPLMIHFKCGFVPVGVFCAMVARLVAQKDTHGWILQEPRDGHNLYKNKVTFRINGAFSITLISKPKQHEIHIARISTTDRALETICQHVLETVCNILDQVISKMKYKQLISSCSDQTLYELGFKCPKHSNDDHLVINRPKGGVKSQPSQPAMSLWLNYLAIERGSTMICLKKQLSINLRDTSLHPSFAQQSLVWFGKATKISFALPYLLPAKDASHDVQSHGLKGDQELPLAKKLNVKNIVNVLHEAQLADGDWAQLGLQLIDHFDSTTIRADHDRASDCMSHTISQWLKTDTKASWGKLAEAVSKVGGYGEATAASVREKAGIAHTVEITQHPTEIGANFLTARTAVTPEKPRVSSQSPPTPTVDIHLPVVTHKAESLHTQAPSTPASTTGGRKQKPKDMLEESKGCNRKLPCGIIVGVLVVLLGIVIWWLLAGKYQSIAPYLPGELQLKFDDRPTLPTLRDFPGRDRSIDIAADIGTDYSKLGTFLLDDNNGKKVKNIVKSKLGDPVDIAVAILKVWIEGKGRRPVTWRTLVTCLRKTDLNVLADDIETVLRP